MDAKRTTVVMEGAAWLTSSVAAVSKEQFIADNLASPYVFAGKSEDQRIEMLGIVYELAVEEEQRTEMYKLAHKLAAAIELNAESDEGPLTEDPQDEPKPKPRRGKK